MNINIGGVDIKVASQEEINEEADKGNMVFACCPTKFGPAGVPNSRTVKCEKCEQDVWISPATYSTWQSCDAPIICLECITQQIKKEA
jgi:hypothetical protein